MAAMLDVIDNRGGFLTTAQILKRHSHIAHRGVALAAWDANQQRMFIASGRGHGGTASQSGG